MFTQLIADLIILIHLGFILFVIFGGLLVIKWKKFIWLHIPAVLWGILIEFFGWICPLTTLENELRQINNSGGYESGFIEHYIIPIIYPLELTREIQILMGIAVIVINLLIYSIIFKKWSSRPQEGK